MSTLQLNCPLCTGLFQVDASAVGAQVACPHCQGAITIPGPAPQHPPQPQNQPGLQLACPTCQGAFQVGPEAAGKQVACPHCRTPVLIPHLQAVSDAGFSPLSNAADSLLPPGAGGPMSPPSHPPRSPVSAPLPPGMGPTKAASAPLPPKPASGPNRPVPAPKPTNAHSAPLPPGMIPAAQKQPSRPVPAPLKPASQPPQPGPTVDSLLPPGAAPLNSEPQLPQQVTNQPISSRPIPLPESSADSLLPPGAGPGMSYGSPGSDLLPPGADSLLPPGAGSSIGDLMPQPLPNALTGGPKTGPKVSVHDPVKKIRNRGVEVELRQFTPEEKDRRRLIKNAIVFIVLSIVLMAVMLILGRQ